MPNSNPKTRQEGQTVCSIGNLLAFNLFITPAYVHFHCCDKSINLLFPWRHYPLAI